MSKMKERNGDKKCALCPQSVGSKGIRLHGMKGKKSEILTVLEMLLPPPDFSALKDESLFPDPEVCNSCFDTLIRTPKTVLVLQNLLGKSLNIQLYRPNRPAWTASYDPVNKSSSRELEERNYEESPSDHHNYESPFLRKSYLHVLNSSSQQGQHFSGRASDIEDKRTRKDNVSHQLVSDDEDLQKVFKAEAPANSTLPFNTTLPTTETERSKEKQIEKRATRCPSSAIMEKRIFIKEKLVEALFKPADPSKEKQLSAEQSISSKREAEAVPNKKSRVKGKGRTLRQQKNVLSNNCRNTNKDSLKIVLQSETVKHTRPVRKCVKHRKTNDFTATCTGALEAVNNEAQDGLTISESLDTVTDISASESDDDYKPPVIKIARNNIKYLKNDFSLKTSKVSADGKHIDWRSVHKKDNISVMDLQNQNEPKDESKSALQELAIETDVLMKKTIQLGRKPTLMKCTEHDCYEMYPSWALLARHIKQSHYGGSLPTCADIWLKLSMMAEEGRVDHKIYTHQCKHDGCEQAFTTEKTLKEHSSFHNKGLSQFCGFPDCPKAFKRPQSLKSHFQTHIQNLIKTSSCNTKALEKSAPGQKCTLRHKSINSVIMAGRHKCPYKDCGESFMKKEKLEIHLCEHSPESRLFCEKCGQSFSCQRYLDVHHKIHIKNEAHAANPPTRSIPCENEGCNKMFTTRENMKSHVLNQHRGRKPCSLPGVFFPCTFPGCGKKFSFRSTLYRHKKLVHKGGDYKLGCKVVQYPCDHDGGCGMVFNRKNLLEEHLVMVHGKSAPKRLLPLRSKALDFTEEICIHCGMVLTQTLLLRHTQLYHDTDTGRNLNESKAFPCHLEGCNEIFNTQEDRAQHIQGHIASPPYCCQVEGCKAVFYLEKNIDNHLWNHSRKSSTCDFDGCSQTFEDQLELAKHSKVHYNGKMKCPWPNCDNWLTETGQLRPHFIAHSKAQHASAESEYVCEVCQLAFSSRWGLMIHKRMHGEEAAAVATPTIPRLAKFSCEEPGCPATFCDQKGFFDHFLYHFTKRTCVCVVEGCNQNFSNLITLSKHTKLHFDGKYQCSWQGCKKLFASPFIVKRHIYRHIVGKSHVLAFNSPTNTSSGTSSTLDKRQEKVEDKQINSKWPLSCSQCFMVFKFQSNLDSHMEYHNEKSEYVCPTCGKKGRHNHAKASSAGKKSGKVHVCSQCGTRYATISGLKFHLLQKHKIGKWPFKCSYCDKGFVSNREMQRHMPSHTKEKPFVCDVCGASFASHTGHRAHMRKHTGQRYICEVEGCGKTYTTAISLRGHMAQHAGFSKICSYCGKTYKNPYGHKCKASREGKRKLTSDPNTAQNQAAQQVPQKELAETTLHLLQPSNSGHQQQQAHQHDVQHQQVLGMIQQHRQPFQHQHQPQHHSQYVAPNGGVLPQTPASFPSLVPNLTPQVPMQPCSNTSSMQQPQMILMTPQMLPGPSGSHNSLALMAIPHNGTSSVPLHHHPQNHHPGMLRPPPPPSQPQTLCQTGSPSPAVAAPLSHINLLHQGIFIPPQSSGVQVQHQQHQSQQHHSNSGISSGTTVVPEGVIPQHPDRGNNGQSSNNSNVQGDYIYNNYVVFWEGQV